MILAETIFVDQRPVGVVRRDSTTRQVAFSPTDGRSLLPERQWRDIDEMKAAVIKAYAKTKKTPVDAGILKLLPSCINKTTGGLVDEY